MPLMNIYMLHINNYQPYCEINLRLWINLHYWINQAVSEWGISKNLLFDIGNDFRVKKQG